MVEIMLILEVKHHLLVYQALMQILVNFLVALKKEVVEMAHVS
jgi:hypothetical protein